MASPAAANTSDPATAAFSEAEAEGVGLCVGGGDDGQEDTSCSKFAAAVRALVEFYSRGQRSMVMSWNTEEDGRVQERVDEAIRGEPLEEVDPEGRGFQSWFNITDDRADLMLTESAGENYELEVAVMASKFAYENMAKAKDLVTTKLQGMHFEFFDCPNLSLGDFKTTQAVAFVRKEGGRNVVYVAFRGSDETNDWRANLDCGHIQVSADWGNVHVGFMKALGFIRNTGSFANRFPNELTTEQWKNPPAYYAVRQWLISELGRLQDKEAVDIVVKVVGHSLGGALAILFVAMLRYHGTDISAVKSTEVITLGQPRVGNSTFAQYMTDKVIRSPTLTYKRMVYSFDPVPRVPSDDNGNWPFPHPTYRHFGTCLYYQGWFKKLRSTDDRNMIWPNLRNPLYFPAAIKENVQEKLQAQWNRVLLKEPDSVVRGRNRTMFLKQFHTVGEYLNAARHGMEPWQMSSSLVRRLLRSLLHYPTAFWNRSRRRRVVITTTDDDDDDVSSYV